MSFDWFKSTHGAPTDVKWIAIGKRAGVPPGVVSAVMWAVLDHASQREERGRVDDFDVESYAAFSGFDEDKINAVLKAMTDKGLIENGVLSGWDKHQASTSTPRVQKHRAKIAEQERAIETDETLHDVSETGCNASNTDKIRPDEIREDESKVESISTPPEGDLSPSGFREWYAAYPRKKQPRDAERAYDKLIASGEISHAELMERTSAFVRANEGRVFPYPASFLNGRRFNDAEPSDNVAGDAPAVVVGRIVTPFDEYWDVCRKKTHKDRAQKLFSAAMKSTPAHILIEARRRYEATRINEEEIYDINPATWLEDKRWLDEPQSANVTQLRRAGSKPSFMEIARRQLSEIEGHS